METAEQRIKTHLTDKNDLRQIHKHIAFSNLNNYYTWKTIKKDCSHNKFNISTKICDKWFETPDGLHSVCKY